MGKASKRGANRKRSDKSAAGPAPRAAAKPRVASKAKDKPPSPAPLPPALPALIVGVVASAGGLEAFIKMLDAMPADSGLTLIFVPHLDPGRASMMSEVLTRHSAMPVSQLVQGEHLQANHVYVIPPNKYLQVREGSAILSGPVQRNSPLNPIDQFLSSLASDQQENAIAVVLSGTSMLGTAGVMEVKASGGMVMVQLPESAEQKGMPQSAVDSGAADYVLAPEDMPKALLSYVAHLRRAVAGGVDVPSAGDQLTQLISLLRARTRFDFHAYRKEMLLRRIYRRMGIKDQPNMGQYVAMLRDDPQELKLLCKDLLISVTQFFRDPEMFQVLQAQVIPELLRNHSAESPLRVWIPACASGEEAYSIAMLLLEAIAASDKACPLQVFATDVDTNALDVARRGIYAESQLAQISPERLARYFTRLDAQRYQIGKSLRDSVLFAQHNVLSDAPFSKVDLVSCRNLLIYIEPSVQQKLISLFHFALNEGGYLVLGPSESVGTRAELFEPLSKKWRIYRRAWSEHLPRLEFPISPVAVRPEARVVRSADVARESSMAEVVQRLLLQEFAPGAVLIRTDYHVLYFYGHTEFYLAQPAGKPSSDLMVLLREGLRSRVRAVVHKAQRENRRVSLSGSRIRLNGRLSNVKVSALPLPAKLLGENLLLITFEEEHASAAPAARRRPSARQDNLVHQLEDELKSMREELRGTIEDLECTNEELTGSNEEMMSMNEELQSANEELESSKEEMQSLNEELNTVNSQLQEKIAAVEETGNDLTNLLASVDTATIFLDVNGIIKRFTSAATRVFRLIAGDVGRPISDIKGCVADNDLEADIKAVLEVLAPREKEVRTDDGRCYLRRVTPYRTVDNRIEGVVLAFTDISAMKNASLDLERRNTELQGRLAAGGELLQRERGFTATVLDALDVLVMVLDRQARIVTFNQACEVASGYSAGEAYGKTQWELQMIVADEERAVRALILQGLRGKRAEPHESRWRHRDGSVRLISWSYSRMNGSDGQVEKLIHTGVVQSIAPPAAP